MGCVREGKVRLSVLKVHFCYDNTLCSITFEPVVRFWCFNLGFEALNVYFKMELSFYYLVGPLCLESAEKRTALSKKCGLRHTVLALNLYNTYSWCQCHSYHRTQKQEACSISITEDLDFKCTLPFSFAIIIEHFSLKLTVCCILFWKSSEHFPSNFSWIMDYSGMIEPQDIIRLHALIRR